MFGGIINVGIESKNGDFVGGKYKIIVFGGDDVVENYIFLYVVEELCINYVDDVVVDVC